MRALGIGDGGRGRTGGRKEGGVVRCLRSEIGARLFGGYSAVWELGIRSMEGQGYEMGGVQDMWV